jgi:cysteine synthase A
LSVERGFPVTRSTMHLHHSVLSTIGNTPLVQLRRVVPKGCARILVKVEGTNPTGSMKDRMAQAMIEAAERDGRLKPGGTVVEYTGGSTGASLALICAAKGYRLRLFSSDAFSEEKLVQMAAFGADLTIIPSEGGRITRSLIESMIAAARKASRAPGTFWTDQLNNSDMIAGYYPLGSEIWIQTKGRVDAFVHAIGTSASLQGVATMLRRSKPGVRIVAVEPAESAVLSGGPPGAHNMEGIGIGFLPPLWNPEMVDEIVPVSTSDAEAMALRLCEEEGLFAGTTSGGNVVAAIEVGRRLGPKATVTTLLVDSGLRYLAVYRKMLAGRITHHPA